VSKVSAPSFNRLVVIGLGLIGGSFAKGMRDKNIFNKVIGVDNNPEHCKEAKRLGLVHEAIDIQELKYVLQEGGVNVVLLAVPLSAMSSIFEVLADADLKDCVITDVGSAKRDVIKAVDKAFGKPIQNFVGGHPIAGSEKSGPSAADAKLFEKRTVVLTERDDTDPKAIDLIKKLWGELGVKDFLNMTEQEHDQTLAATSHLPHMLAFALTAELSERKKLTGIEIANGLHDYAKPIAAGGLRDVTRIAASDPLMWRDIAISNKDCLLEELKEFSKALNNLIKTIDNGNAQELFDLFSRAKAARDPLFGGLTD